MQQPLQLIRSLAIVTLLAGRCWAGDAAEVHHAQGELVGEITSSTALLQSRLTAIAGPVLADEGDVPGIAGMACFEWSTAEDFADAERTDWQAADAASDFIVRTPLTGLRPGVRYYYRLIYGPDREQTQVGPTRQFKTLPDPAADGALTFCMGSCMNYAFFLHGKKGSKGAPSMASDEDKRLGYPSFAAMAALRPDFFIGTGDIVYYDHPAATAAQTLPQLRKKWHEQFRFPRLVEFFAQTPAYWSKDDHDFRFNDADLGGSKLPAPSTGIDIFREQMPIHPAGDRSSPTYRTHRVHRNLQLWFTEGRDYRSPNRMDDGPQKSLWGQEQREWLQRMLKASDATWKVIITPTPMVGPDTASKRDNHANLQGFRHEADAFFRWLRDNNQAGVMTFCGDRHWQYHSIHPLGVEEFSVGALNDENSIAGVRPGSPNSSDPEGLIQQPYLYPEATGGFLFVRVESDTSGLPRLLIEFHDDTGRRLYSVAKSAMPKTGATKGAESDR